MTRFPRALSIAIAADPGGLHVDHGLQPFRGTDRHARADPDGLCVAGANPVALRGRDRFARSKPVRCRSRERVGSPARRTQKPMRSCSTDSTARTWTMATRSTSRLNGTRTPSSAACPRAAGSRQPSTRPARRAASPTRSRSRSSSSTAPLNTVLQIIDQRSGFIGATQPATRVRMTGNDADVYEYVIQLGPTLEEGPNLVARTSSLMGGDYDLNRADPRPDDGHDGVHRRHPVTPGGR